MARMNLAQAMQLLKDNDYYVRVWHTGNTTYSVYDPDLNSVVSHGSGYDVVRYAKRFATPATPAMDISSVRFGIEIECFHRTDSDIRYHIEEKLNSLGINASAQDYNHRVQSQWKIVTDASVNYHCAEVVSPVLVGQQGIDEVKTVMDALTELGCEVNRSCGLHVHIDLNRQETLLRPIFDFYQKNERLFDSLMPQSRRGDANCYCHSLRDYSYTGWRHNTRYVKLNPMSFVKYGTIEFRQHSGSLNGDKAEHWIKLVASVVEYCKSGRSPRQFSSLDEMVRELNLVDTSWYLERAQDLSA